ncbi:hypothetical protein G7054_g5663 [Neopestalotiopsis clavispora]|nr:hypothetical protein G7054_g5663 [Neopestalotiopsis clavispora]
MASSNSERQTERQPTMTRSQFLLEVRFSPYLVETDIGWLHNPEHVTADNGLMVRKYKDYLLGTWFTTDTNSVKLINAQLPDDMNPLLSIVHADFWKEMQADETKNITLAFFQGEHPEMEPAEIALNLLGQLVKFFPYFLEGAQIEDAHLCLNKCIHWLGKGDMKKILRVLRFLLLRLPDGYTVYLVFDGLSFEDESQERGMRELIVKLRALCLETVEGEPEVTYKFLFSGSTITRPIKNIFRRKEIINLPRNPWKGPEALHFNHWLWFE